MIQKVDTAKEIKVTVEVPDGVRIKTMSHVFLLHSSEAADAQQFQLFSTETTEQTDVDSVGNSRLFPVELHPPREPLPSLSKRVATSSRSQHSLWEVFESEEVQEALAAESKMEGYETSVRQFCDWFQKNDSRSMQPEVVSLDIDRNLLQKYFTWQLGRVSLSTAKNRLSGMTVVWRTLHELGHLKKPVPEVRKKRIVKRSGATATDHIPIGMSLSDAATMIQAIDSMTFKASCCRHGRFSPRRFMKLVIANSLFYGFNIGDVIALKKKHNGGLRWSEVSRDPLPPFRGGETIDGAANPLGWIKFTRNKTKNDACVPICPYMDELLTAVKGVNSEFVLPMPPECADAWYRQFRNIKARAGLLFTQAQLKAALEANDPKVYDVSLSGQSPSRSARKRASVLWTRHGNRNQASHMLAHSTRAGAVSEEDLSAGNEVASDTTERYYAGSEVYREIVQTAPKVFDEIEQYLQLMQ